MTLTKGVSMIEQWGTEVALVIAVVTGIFVLQVGKKEMNKTSLGRWFQFILAACLLISVAMYFGLRMSGVNP
jgi:hypothetical protein